LYIVISHGRVKPDFIWFLSKLQPSLGFHHAKEPLSLSLSLSKIGKAISEVISF
jgi:hypothetical protein